MQRDPFDGQAPDHRAVSSATPGRPIDIAVYDEISTLRVNGNNAVLNLQETKHDSL
jgi:hypothetical protein